MSYLEKRVKRQSVASDGRLFGPLAPGQTHGRNSQKGSIQTKLDNAIINLRTQFNPTNTLLSQHGGSLPFTGIQNHKSCT